MRAFASSFRAWESMEKQEGTKEAHGLTFPLAVVGAIGAPHGLDIAAEESGADPLEFDAVFIGVLDARCMIGAAGHFARWRIPFRSRDRSIGKWPLVWAGGQGIRNPMPLADVFDLCVIGDAEDPLPELLRHWANHGNSVAFLKVAALVPGVFVPSEHNTGEARIVQSVSSDIGITLRNDIRVSLDGSRRVEIARGCKSKCGFCTLGWTAPMRENSSGDVLTSISKGPKRIHLQAGDAEAYTEIDLLRASMLSAGAIDLGWTGRIDSLASSGSAVGSQKRYAFGVEAVSYRLRRAVGKGYLTDERLISDTVKFFQSISGDGKGRGAWHLIAGLPTAKDSEVHKLAEVLRQIDTRMQGQTPRNLSLHWQPFQPLPGTPMQWFGGGTGARRMLSLMRSIEGMPWCKVRQVAGRTDTMALICTVLARSDARGALLLEALHAGTVTPDEAVSITGSPYLAIDPDGPLPWDFILTPYSRETLRRAYDVILGRLSDRRFDSAK